MSASLCVECRNLNDTHTARACRDRASCECWVCFRYEAAALLQRAADESARAEKAEAALAAAQAENERLRGELAQVELQVSSNENAPESVLANIGRMTRAALALPADSSALREFVSRATAFVRSRAKASPLRDDGNGFREGVIAGADRVDAEVARVLGGGS